MAQETQEMQFWSLGWEDPLKRKCPPISAFLPGESHGQRSLVGYSPWDCLTVWLSDSQRIRHSWVHTHHRFYPKDIFPSIQPFDEIKRSGLSGLKTKNNKKQQIISHCLTISWCLVLWWDFSLITGIKNRNNDYLTPTLNHLVCSIYLFYITSFIFRQPYNVASTLNVW